MIKYPSGMSKMLSRKEPSSKDSLVYGILNDFCGWLTSRKERICMSSADECYPAVDALVEFMKIRGINCDAKPNFNWTSILNETSDETGVLPMVVSETGRIDEPVLETITCSSISGGEDYKNNMPSRLTLQRLLNDGTMFESNYQQVDTIVPLPE